MNFLEKRNKFLEEAQKSCPNKSEVVPIRFDNSNVINFLKQLIECDKHSRKSRIIIK